MNKEELDIQLEAMMPVELQQDIGCDAEPPHDKRSVNQRVMRIIARCIEQAAEIEGLKKQELSSRVWKNRVDEAAKVVDALEAKIKILKAKIASQRGGYYTLY